MRVRRQRDGFTFPELLNMLVVGAILAAIVYGQRQAHRGPPVDPALAPMRAALLQLKEAEDGFRGRLGHYSAHLDSLTILPAAGITRAVDRADSASWHAVATKEGSAARCELSVGTPGAADSVVCHPAP